jgi:hypothetical protein
MQQPEGLCVALDGNPGNHAFGAHLEPLGLHAAAESVAFGFGKFGQGLGVISHPHNLPGPST